MATRSDDDERKAFYNSLLQLSWLAPEVRRAIMKVLGRSYPAYKADFNHGAAVMLRHLIAKEKARIKGERPRDGVHEAAVTEVARRQGMTGDALKKRLQRHRRRRKNDPGTL